MADIDITEITDDISMGESAGSDVVILRAVYDSAAAAELANSALVHLRSVYDAASIAEAITGPTRYFEGSKSPSAFTIGIIDRDWALTEQIKSRSMGINLKAIILIPGASASTFSIKDGSDTGPYLYYGAVSAATVLVYGGVKCCPVVDYSECSLSDGHKITFVY